MCVVFVMGKGWGRERGEEKSLSPSVVFKISAVDAFSTTPRSDVRFSSFEPRRRAQSVDEMLHH